MAKKIAIIGAGPTGLALASFLHHYGLEYKIFEQNKTTTPYSKAMIIHARTMEELDDMGIADLFLKEGEKVTKAKLLNQKNKKETLNFSNIGKGLSKFPYFLSLEQSKTEKIFVQHLKKNNIQVQRQHEISKIEKKRGQYRLFFANGKTYDADYIVGCDGARSFVRHYLGFEFAGSTIDEKFFVADTVIKSQIINEKKLYIKFIEKNFGLIFPINVKKKQYRVIGVLPHKYREDENVAFEDIQDYLISSLQLPLEFKKVHWFSTYRVHSRYCHFSKGNILLAGDAAHIHSPAGGRGMNTGIQDAYNLAWKLAYTINNDAKKGLLESYDQERYPVAKELIETTDRMFSFLTTSRVFGFFFRNVIIKILLLLVNTGIINKKVFPFLGMLTIAYNQSSALTQSSIKQLRAGQRLPYQKKLYQQLLGKGFIVLAHGITIETSNIEVQDIPDYFNLNCPHMILLRPDKHIAYIGDDVTQLQKYFTKLGI